MDTVVAHIRHATRGGLSLANTQPFQRELDGRMVVFAHNGDLGEPMPSGGRFRPVGETDSEAAFCALLPRLAGQDDIAALFDIFAAFAVEVRARGPANLILGFQDALFIHADRRAQRPGVIAPPGLWMLRRTCIAPDEPVFAGTGARVAGDAVEVTLVASVPLSDEAWRPLHRGATLALRGGAVLMQRTLPDPR